MGKRYGGALKGSRPYHQRADWLWKPIPPNPVLDANSAAIRSALTAPANTYTSQPNAQTAICDMVQFGCAVVTDITPSTPRYTVRFAHQTGVAIGGDWGPNPFGSETVPFPRTTTQRVASTGTNLDKHLTVIDPTHNKVFNIWVAEYDASWDTGSVTWNGQWGAMCDLDGDGRETGGSSTGAGLSRIAGIVRVSEIAARYIPHALFFSSNIVKQTAFRFPATKTDGSGAANTGSNVPVASSLEEGMRLQLDPSINLAAISGITAGELAIGRCMQTYGAYCGDNGGAAMAFLFELEGDATLATNTVGAVYSSAGLSDYFTLSKIPWSTGLRVLNSWNGL